jgi:hypothetical protein
MRKCKLGAFRQLNKFDSQILRRSVSSGRRIAGSYQMWKMCNEQRWINVGAADEDELDRWL